MRIVGQNSDVHFGEVDEEEPDWRNELEEETDPDDEELEYTPQDVIDILGFDPKEFSEPEPTDNESNPMSLNTTKALLIINAKKVSKKGLGKTKGWTDEARAKAAMTRKAKKKVVSGKSGETDARIKNVKSTISYLKDRVKATPAHHPQAQEYKRSLAHAEASLSKVTKKVSGKSGETTPKKKTATVRGIMGEKIPTKGNYVSFSEGKKSHVVKVKGGLETTNYEGVLKRLEKKLGRKLPKDPKSGFASFSHYSNGEELGGG